MKINQPHKIYNTAEQAQAAAAELQSFDEDWTFKVSKNPHGESAIIAIYDEDGEFIRYW